MILRIDRLQTELPPPSDPDPEGASRVQELMGGRFGEMSTLMNYTFQSFNFRGRRELRPFYDLIANIAAEEYGHIEVVSATINSLLTGPPRARRPPPPMSPAPRSAPARTAPACGRTSSAPAWAPSAATAAGSTGTAATSSPQAT